MLTDFSPLLITLFAFGAVATAVFVIGQFIAVHVRVQKRMAIPGRGARAAATSGLGSSFEWLVSTYFDEKRFGVQGSVREELRRELIRAGFFRTDAINYYIFARMASVVVLTIAGYLCAQYFTDTEWYVKFAMVAGAMLLAVLGPNAYIARRKRKLLQGYRVDFPDMLDLIVVCADAGLSLEAALERISREISRQNYYLGTNLMIMGAETRAGRSSIDALSSLAVRLGLDEAHSLAAILRQSIELGTDVGEALRVFADEMRDRRLLRAEERANQLPVKMVGPLGMFIFPVILGLVSLPVILRLMMVLSATGR